MTRITDEIARIQTAEKGLEHLLEELRQFAAPIHLDQDLCSLQDVWRQPPKLREVRIELLTLNVEYGKSLQFALSLCSALNREQALMIDYIIHHKKANGSTSLKVFKWKTISLPPKKKATWTKIHAIKQITTRVYYAGMHKLELVVNGVSVGTVDFQLQMP